MIDPAWLAAYLALRQCHNYLEGRDLANAALHCAPVRYSPLTKIVAETLKELHEIIDPDDVNMIPEPKKN